MNERRANLRITHIQTTSLVRMGVFSSIDQLLGDVTGTAGAFTETFTFPVIFIGSFLLAIFEIVVTTALVTLFGFIYNLTVPYTRGLEVTLAEDVIESTDQL